MELEVGDADVVGVGEVDGDVLGVVLVVGVGEVVGVGVGVGVGVAAVKWESVGNVN